jgi:hypothetical protein
MRTFEKDQEVWFATRSNPEVRSGIFKGLNPDKTHATIDRDGVLEYVPLTWLVETREKAERLGR